MRVLDLSAGNRGVWFDKNCPEVVYVDIRENVKPSVVCNTLCLPFAADTFGLIVFDPPHVNFGARSNMTTCYGHITTAGIRDLIRGSAVEAFRVGAAQALMAFKWNDHDQNLSTVLDLLRPEWEPMFGHKVATRAKHACSTYWVLLRKPWK
jgi:hypothetical protein